LAASFSDIPAYVLSRLNLTAKKSCSKDSATESCQSSQSGMTCEHSTADRGEEKLMSCAVDFHAKTSALLGKEKESTENEADCGEKWSEWFAKLDPIKFLWKTHQPCLLEEWESSLETWPKWGTMRDGECFQLKKLTAYTLEKESLFSLPTIPTISKNEWKGSSKKRFLGSKDFHGAKASESLRTCSTDPTYLHPSFAEWMMWWPIMWTELAPLETAKFQQWLNSHGKP